MATLPAENTFEGGSDETTITTGNSGGGSGEAFDVVTIAGTSALVYDTARAAHGGVSARITAGNNLAQVGWTFTEVTELWGRVYVWLTDAPNENIRIVGWEDLGNAAPGRILINTFTGGVIQVLDENFAGSFASAVIPYQEWVRIEWRILCHPTAGELEATMYQGDSLTPITNGTVLATGRDTGVGTDRCTFGHNTGWAAAAEDFWIDSLEINATGFPGPATTPAPARHILVPARVM